MASQAELDYARRAAGLMPNGEVHLRDFDQGVVETLGGQVVDSNYYLLSVPGVTAPPGLPGVPINFSFPEDTDDAYVFPQIVVTRDDISPATSRIHPGAKQYRAPAPGALPVQVTWGSRTAHGFNRMQEQVAAIPYDISYTLSVLGYRRGAPARQNGNSLLEYALSRYQPYSAVEVYDSVGERRVYFATVDAASSLDEAVVVGERVIGWTIPITVEAELDLNTPLIYATVQSMKATLTQTGK